MNARNRPAREATNRSDVVRASLAGLRRNAIIVVPGTPNKVLVAGSSIMPNGLKRRLAGAVMKRRGR